MQTLDLTEDMTDDILRATDKGRMTNAFSTPVDLPDRLKQIYKFILSVNNTLNGISNASYAFNVNYGRLALKWMQ